MKIKGNETNGATEIKIKKKKRKSYATSVGSAAVA
jgi:hypothetical protein